jgi:hypothetical protein
MSDAELVTSIRSLRVGRRKAADVVGATLGYVLRAYIREARRVPRRGEMMAALAMLDRGARLVQSPVARIVAMTLAAAVAAALGRRVHVLAPDEARAIAIAAVAQGALTRLNIAVGALEAAQSLALRQWHCRRPVVFGGIAQFAQDYLRATDRRAAAGSPSRRAIELLAAGAAAVPNLTAAPPDFALIDSIDVILCDSGNAAIFTAGSEVDQEALLIFQVIGLIGELVPDVDFTETQHDRVRLLPAGQHRLGLIGKILGSPWAELPPVRQFRLAERALTARAISREQYRVVDGEVEPLTDEMRSLLADPDNGDPGIARFLAAQERKDIRSAASARRISLHRLACKYRQVGGVMARSDLASGELRRRYGLAAIPEPRQPHLLLLPGRGETQTADLLVSRVQAAIGRRLPLLIVAADQDAVANTANILDRAGIASARLSGQPTPEDAALIAQALQVDLPPLIIGPGRNLPMSAFSPEHRASVLVVGVERMTTTPDRLVLDVPSGLTTGEPTAVFDAHCEGIRENLSYIERALFHLCIGRSSHRAQAMLQLLLRLAIRRNIRWQERRRAVALKSEEQHLMSLSFAGSVIERY